MICWDCKHNIPGYCGYPDECDMPFCQVESLVWMLIHDEIDFDLFKSEIRDILTEDE